MAKDQKLAKQPMLYIAQPVFKPAEVSMQSSFRSPYKKERNIDAPSGSVKEKEIRLRSQHTTKDKSTEKDISNEIEEKQEAPKSTQNKSRERRQRFQDLSLEEKVEYFFQLSPHVPKMKCEVSTVDTQHRGYIIDYKDGNVYMKTFQRPFEKEVPFESIQDIRLMGF